MQAAKVRATMPRTIGRPDESMLVRLRRATADAHRRVEARLFPAALTDRTSYARMLQVLLALHEPLEARMAEHPGLLALGIDPVERRKSPRLRADLVALGMHDAGPAPTAASQALAASPGASAALPDLLGTLYVLEGSTLGGRVLLEQVRARLGDAPTSFLTGYGDDTARFWRRTRTALVEGVRIDADPAGAEQRLIAAAGATFSHLDRLLDDDGWAAA